MVKIVKGEGMKGLFKVRRVCACVCVRVCVRACVYVCVCARAPTSKGRQGRGYDGPVEVCRLSFGLSVTLRRADMARKDRQEDRQTGRQLFVGSCSWITWWYT